MGKDLMYDCERKARFLDRSCPTDRSKRTFAWLPVKVVDVPDNGDIRCRHCQGSVKIHRQQTPNGPADHVEHKTRTDSENCKGGFYFKGVHRISLRPVE